jgi:hypothetical protein
MKPVLSPSQGRVVRALAFYLSNDGEARVTIAAPDMIVEEITSGPWASLTFAGERHHLAVRLPAGAAHRGEIDGAALAVPGAIVAVERAEWTDAADGPRLALDLIAIAPG